MFPRKCKIMFISKGLACERAKPLCDTGGGTWSWLHTACHTRSRFRSTQAGGCGSWRPEQNFDLPNFFRCRQTFIPMALHWMPEEKEKESCGTIYPPSLRAPFFGRGPRVTLTLECEGIKSPVSKLSGTDTLGPQSPQILRRARPALL